MNTPRLSLRVPVIVLVLAATAIPIELRPHGSLDYFGFDAADFCLNVLGYVTVGLVLGGVHPLRSILWSALISVFAETAQLGMMHRDPSVVDVAANVLGATAGVVIAARWRIRRVTIALDKRWCTAAAVLAVGLVGSVWLTAGDALNDRGGTSPGTLEARWDFDKDAPRTADDSSGHRLDGRFSKTAKSVPGILGRAIRLDGANDFVALGRARSFRLVGSMTISAWINSRAYPPDDAAIVSTLLSLGGPSKGFQLDTTIDRGSRTIGFKLSDECGDLVARYGRTPLLLNTWYHVAGVYNARQRTIDVFLDGALDDGFLTGTVGHAQRSSRNPLYIGKRSDAQGFDFAGLIDDVRIYSRALTGTEILAVMQGKTLDESVEASRLDVPGQVSTPPTACSWSSEREDARLPATVALVGLLIAVACVGIFPRTGRALGVLLSILAGIVLFRVASPTVPPMNQWLFPLTSLSAAIAVISSIR